MYGELGVYSMVRSVPNAPSMDFAALDHYLDLDGVYEDDLEGLGFTEDEFAEAFGGVYEDDLEGIDDLDDDDDDDLSGRWKSRRLARRKRRRSRRLGRRRGRKARRFARKGKLGRSRRQVRIAYKIAARAARKSGLKLTNRLRRRGIRAAMKASRSKGVKSSVRVGLQAAGLSSTQARQFADIGMAIARKGGDKAAVAKMLAKIKTRRAARALRKSHTSPTSSAPSMMQAASAPSMMQAATSDLNRRLQAVATLTASDATAPTMQLADDEEEESDFEPSEASDDSLDMEFADDEDDYEDDEDLDGFGVLDLDSLKPYFPWIALAAGITLVTLSSKSPASKKKGSK